MELPNRFYKADLSLDYGVITSYKKGDRELLSQQQDYCAVIVKLIDDDGNYIKIKTGKADATEKTENGYKFTYNNVDGYNFNVVTYVKCSESSPEIRLTMSYENNTGFLVEWVDFGSFTVPKNLKADGGDGVIFWPVAEGGLIEDAKMRNNAPGTTYVEPDYNIHGWRGVYPGATPFQFMSYYTQNDGGFYLGAHDTNRNIKLFEYHPLENGVRLENYLFPGDISTNYSFEYDIVLRPIENDWYDAADIYREWAEENGIFPKKARENENISPWMDESPITLFYPIKGTADNGDMSLNCYYPYVDGLKYVYRIAEKTGSKVMPILMHWEGTAPWAPPFAWPPYGGEEALKEAIDKLHSDGHYLGLYASGIGWTTHSYNNPDYNTDKLYKELDIENILCRTPKQTIEPTNVVGPPIKEGHNLCPANEVIKDIVLDEITNAAKLGCDYYQYFDQNLGGQACLCYSKNHNHVPVPGKWMTEHMNEMYQRTVKQLRGMNSTMSIGCECAAGDCFIDSLTVNDSRFNSFYYFGKPVPAYSYITHEYTNNFMGNNCCVSCTLKCEENPSNLAFRLAYSFICGNLLSLTLGDEGCLTWGWVHDWKDNVPKNTDEILAFVNALNSWRTGIGKPFLRYGRMQRPKKLLGIDSYDLMATDCNYEYHALLSSRFVDSGVDVQFVVNFLGEKKSFSIECDCELFTDAKSTTSTKIPAGTKIEMAPMSAIMLKF